jgi:hypothetical protein
MIIEYLCTNKQSSWNYYSCRLCGDFESWEHWRRFVEIEALYHRIMTNPIAVDAA